MNDKIKEIYDSIDFEKELPPIEKRNKLLQVRSDRLFHDLFNENDMDTLEWSVMQILNADYDEIHNHVSINNARLVNTYQEEKGKCVDLVVDYKGEKIIIEMNNNYIGNYMRNLLYAFNTISNYYNVGTGTVNFSKIKARVILVNLNWHSTKQLASESPKKEEILLPYPDSKFEDDDYVLKIINVNLDFYNNVCYNKIDKWEKLWKLLTINDYHEMNKFLEEDKMLKQYKKKLYAFSNSEGYMSLMFNEDIERNALIEGYFKAGIKEGIEQGIEQGIKQGITSNQNKIIMNMHNENIPIELISKCVGMKEEEVNEIIKKNN